MTVSLDDVVRQSTEALTAALGLDRREARLEARILLCRALRQPPAYLAGHGNDPISASQAADFAALLQRRLGGEPIAYILGEREFYSLGFKTTPAVLIPRPETELLVDLALQRIPEHVPCRVLDLGTGSGAVAIALALQRPLARVTAVERSPDAVAVAQENARRHGAGNLRLMQGDWFAPLGGETFDLIVSNPPYVAAADPHLTRGDVRFEPLSALASGADGLDDIRAIAAAAPRHLEPQGWLLLEHGYDQGGACRELLRRCGFAQVETLADLAGLARVTCGCSQPPAP